MANNVCVIGSGPAGIACAWQLIREGARVLLLDAGQEIEASILEKVSRFRNTAPELWNKTSLFGEEIKTSVSNTAFKKLYGSDFAYRPLDEDCHFEFHRFEARPSFARGGFSNVWGATLQPYLQEDIEDWPITIKELEPFYDQILSFMPASSPSNGLRLSPQMEDFMKDLLNSRAHLSQKEICLSESRLAVQTAKENKPGCIYCGFCMQGCPFGYIYHSAQTLEKLLEHPHFNYRGGFFVKKLLESREAITISGFDLHSKHPVDIEAAKVYLGAGCLSTTKILLQSLDCFGQEVKLLDSQYFLLPLLRFQASKNISSQPLHTLAQIFMQMRDKKIARQTSFLQFYGYNHFYDEALKIIPGFWGLRKTLLEHLIVAQGYLPSSVSSFAKVRLEFSQKHPGETVLAVQSDDSKKVHQTVRRLARKLLHLIPAFKAIPLIPFTQVMPTGRGFHTGGTFPMRNNPGRFESDRMGRPYGFRRLYVIDSSVFPSIPAGPITFTIMANAARIASGTINDE